MSTVTFQIARKGALKLATRRAALETMREQLLNSCHDRETLFAETPLAQRLNYECHLLDDTEHAIKKLAAHTYGLCERCDHPIPAKRLDALPWARFCIDCQSQAA